MGTYATNGDVIRNIPGRPISSSSSPSTTDIDNWILQAEALLTGALTCGGITVPITDASGVVIMEAWAVLWAEGHTRMALAAGVGDGANDDGKDLIESFNAVIDDIKAEPGQADAMLNGGSQSESTSNLRGYATDNIDGKSTANGDFDPTFTRDETF